MEYATPVWFCGKQINKLEKVHTSYIKRVLGVRDQTSHLAIYGETGRTPLHIRQQYLTIKYWCRIINLYDAHILKCLYKDLLHQCNSTDWIKTLKDSLKAAGFNDPHKDLSEIDTTARSNPTQF